MRKILCDECGGEVGSERVGEPRFSFNFHVGGEMFNATIHSQPAGLDFDEKDFAICAPCLTKAVSHVFRARIAPGAKLFIGRGGALVSDQKIEGMTQKLTPDNAKYYGGPYLIGETLSKGAAKFIAEALGATIVAAPATDLNNKL